MKYLIAAAAVLGFAIGMLIGVNIGIAFHRSMLVDYGFAEYTIDSKTGEISWRIKK